MNLPTRSAPAVVRAAATRNSIKVERVTCSIGAELSGISLGDAARDDALFAEVRSLLLQHKVLFLSGQDVTRTEHVAFARRLGELEDHPVLASDREHPGLVLIDKGPLVMNWVAISGGMDAPNIYNLANFLRAIPDGSMLTVESSMRNVLPINMMGMAMGLHVRCGIEDNLWNQSRTEKMSTVEQIEQLVRISREFGREVATGKEAREICKIGVFYDTVEETLAANGFAPNPKGRQQGYLRKVA